MKNKIVGRLVSKKGCKVYLPLPLPEMVELAISKEDDAWDRLCEMLVKHGIMDPRGNVHIDHLVINGKEKVFH
jgi:hypothetical protein